MNRLGPVLLVAAVLSTAANGRLLGQMHPPFKDEHWNGHFGFFAGLTGSNFVVVGSAFVYGPKKEIVTCGHVAQDSIARGLTNWIYIAPGLGMRNLRLGYVVSRYDLAMFKVDGDIPGQPMAIGDFKKIRPGDKIHYYGYDQRFTDSVKKLGGMMNEGIVTATGSALNDGIIIDFLEFSGVGIPGYSGGPVFNERGELVAVMREAWTKQGIKGGPQIPMNRAFSLEFLRISEEPVFNTLDSFSSTNKPPSSPEGTMSTTSLLDALDFPRSNQNRTNK